jgi:hypothetical protein
MNTFLQRFANSIHGALNGFDRIRFRGTQRLIANVRGLSKFLSFHGILMKDFKPYVTGITEEIRQQVEAGAATAGMKVEYVNDSNANKEELAAAIAKQTGRTTGIQAVLSAVEPCRTFFVRKDPDTGLLALQNRPGKCLHYYHYWRHETLGPCHVRLQTWFPFNVFVCVNGRDMLAGQLDRVGMKYRKRDNCFTWVEDVAMAQRLLDEQVKVNWSEALTGLLTATHPGWSQWPGMDHPYYWSANETEWATDVMFKSAADLSRLMPRFVQLGMTGLGCGDVMRFLGRPVPVSGMPHGGFMGEVEANYIKRPEGVRLKFRVNQNSAKIYDKQGSALRAETTINNPRDMKSYRTKEGDPEGEKEWRRMKKGVSDLPRRAEISQKSNERCLNALASIETGRTLGELTADVCKRKIGKGRPARALNPLADHDRRLLLAVGRGEFLLNGFRNRDIRRLLFADATEAKDAGESKRRSAAVTRLLGLLREHGVIKKVPKTHRYQVTERGRELITGLAAAHAAIPLKSQAAA